MAWNGRGEVVCPLRGQSLESRLAAQASVGLAIVTPSERMNPSHLSAMLNGCWDFAKLMLSKGGEFYPFGETCDSTGKRTMQGADPGDPHPSSKAVYELLEQAFMAAASQGEIAGFALAADVTIPEQYETPYRDGIRVHIESPGFARYVYLPYRVSKNGMAGRLLGQPYEVAYGESFAVEVEARFFGPGSPTTGCN